MEILVTKRLSLRPPHDLDADDLAQHLARWNICRTLVGAPFPFDRTDAIDWIRRSGVTGASTFTIHRQRLIGAIDLVAADRGRLALSYWLAEDAWGHGFMAEALRAVLGQAFARHPDRIVAASVTTDNVRALRLQEQLGFRVTGAGEAFSAARQAVVPLISSQLAASAFSGAIGSSYSVAA